MMVMAWKSLEQVLAPYDAIEEKGYQDFMKRASGKVAALKVTETRSSVFAKAGKFIAQDLVRLSERTIFGSGYDQRKRRKRRCCIAGHGR